MKQKKKGPKLTAEERKLSRKKKKENNRKIAMAKLEAKHKKAIEKCQTKFDENEFHQRTQEKFEAKKRRDLELATSREGKKLISRFKSVTARVKFVRDKVHGIRSTLAKLHEEHNQWMQEAPKAVKAVDAMLDEVKAWNEGITWGQALEGLKSGDKVMIKDEESSTSMFKKSEGDTFYGEVIEDVEKDQVVKVRQAHRDPNAKQLLVELIEQTEKVREAEKKAVQESKEAVAEKVREYHEGPVTSALEQETEEAADPLIGNQDGEPQAQEAQA